jgi:hypothetical protein
MPFPHLADSTPFVAHVRSRKAGAVAALALAAVVTTNATAAASIMQSTRTKPISVAIVGDSLANDLGRGMEALFAGKPGIRVIKQTRFATGLVRTDYFDWNRSLRGFLHSENPDVIVVVIGGNDRQPIRLEDRRLDPLTKPWLTEYDRRVAHFMNTLKRERTKVYWIALPVVRSESLSDAYQAMNQIYRRQATRHGFQYLNVSSKFQTQDGAYSSFGRSLEGVKRKLRKDDGMHFTDAGGLLLAAHVARAIGLR